jgi:hypothetical protein
LKANFWKSAVVSTTKPTAHSATPRPSVHASAGLEGEVLSSRRGTQTTQHHAACSIQATR